MGCANFAHPMRSTQKIVKIMKKMVKIMKKIISIIFLFVLSLLTFVGATACKAPDDGGDPPPTPPPAEQTLDLTVMSFNIRVDKTETEDVRKWVNRKEAVAEYINGQDAAIICLQEVNTAQYEYLYEQITEKYNVIWFQRDNGEIVEGNAIAFNKSLLNKVSENIFWLSNTPEEMSKGWDAAYNRICVNAVFEDKTTGFRFAIYNTHLDHVGENARINGISVITERVEHCDYPALVMGDFNTQINTTCYNVIADKMQDCMQVAPVTDSGNTFNSWGNNVDDATKSPIDFIFATSDIKPLTFNICRDKWGEGGVNYYSDHYGVKTLVRFTYDEDETTPSNADTFSKVISTVEEYNQFVDTTAKNTYAGHNVVISENITLSDNFKQLPNNFAGNIYTAEGKKITCNSPNGYVALAVDSTRITSVDYECVINSALKITENNYTNLLRVSHTNNATTYVSPEQVAALGFSGGYTGGAIKINIYTASYALKYDVNNISVNNAQDIKYVSIYMATDGTAGYTSLGKVSGKNTLVTSDTLLYPLSAKITSEKANTWVRYIVAYEDFLSSTYADEGLLYLFKTARVDGFTSSFNVYIGNIDFLTEKPNELVAKQIPELSTALLYYSHEDNPTTPVANKISLIDAPTSISGEYTGEKALKIGKNYTKYCVMFNFDPANYDLTGYTHLSIWIACDEIVTSDGYIHVANSKSLLPESCNFSKTSNNTGIWKQYFIPINDLLSQYQEYGYVKLMRISLNNANTADGTRAYLYVGDMSFVTLN